MTRLGDICEFKYGKSLPEKIREAGDYLVFGSNGAVGTHTEAITRGPTIVIGRKGSVGEVNWAGTDCWPIDTTYFIDRSATAVDIRWLYYALKNLRLPDLNKATGIPGLNRADAYDRRLLIPPLREQKRIAAILDQVDDLRRKRQATIDLHEEAERSTFLQMFGNPLHWDRADLAPLGKHITLVNGRAYSQHELLSAGTPVVRIQNLNGGERWYYSDLQLPDAKYCEAGDLLFAWSATFGPYIWNGPRAIFHYHIWRLELAPTIDKLYAFWLLKILSDEVKRGGRGISMTHATKGGMEERLIPIPPLADQIAFARKISKMHELRHRKEEALLKLDGLVASLQHRAFRGEL